MDQSTTADIRFELEIDSGGPRWTGYRRHGIHKGQVARTMPRMRIRPRLSASTTANPTTPKAMRRRGHRLQWPCRFLMSSYARSTWLSWQLGCRNTYNAWTGLPTSFALSGSGDYGR